MKNQPFEWTQRCALRIYVSFRQPPPNTHFWGRHFGPSLGQVLLQRAQAANLQQAVLYHIKAGYLAGEVITHHFSESTPASHPLCLELIDTYERLMDYIIHNRPLLVEATVVMSNPQTFQLL